MLQKKNLENKYPCPVCGKDAFYYYVKGNGENLYVMEELQSRDVCYDENITQYTCTNEEEPHNFYISTSGF